MKFVPYHDKIVIKPQKTSSVFGDTTNEEVGEVISVGTSVTFVKPGDLVCFDSWGCAKTPKIDGIEYYVVSDISEVIIGKLENDTEAE